MSCVCDNSIVDNIKPVFPESTINNYPITPSEIGIAVTTTSGAFGILIVGASTYQHVRLIGKSNLQVIFVNNIAEFKISGQFTIDPVTGIITRPSNVWQPEDTLVII